MSTFLAVMLIGHIILGLLAIIAFYASWMNLLRQKPRVSRIRKLGMSGLVLFILSWITGGYYYLTYYGSTVKPQILAATHPWAHSIFTETKEHVFLFLPFLAAAFVVTTVLLGDGIETNHALKRSLAFLAGLITLLGIAITIAGVVISGGTK